MSNLKRDIDEIVKKCQVQSIKSYELATKEPLAEALIQDSWREAKNKATTQIINLIESIIPEPDKHTWRAYGQPDGTVVCDHCNLAEDVNNLLSSQVADIKSKLIGEE